MSQSSPPPRIPTNAARADPYPRFTFKFPPLAALGDWGASTVEDAGVVIERVVPVGGLTDVMIEVEVEAKVGVIVRVTSSPVPVTRCKS